MLELFFVIIRHVFTLVFGVVISAEFLDIVFNKKNILTLAGFSAMLLIAQGGMLIIGDVEAVTAVYPAITHVPLLLIFIFVFKKRLFPSLLAVTTAYLCCQIANWLSTIGNYFYDVAWYEDLTYTLTLVMTMVIVDKVVVSAFAAILSKNDKSLIPFSIIPICYYVFDYVSTVYTEMFYKGNVIAIEFPPFLLSVAYILFNAVYYKQYEEKQEIENRNRLIIIKQEQSQKDIDSIKRNERIISIIRHDMRHFLNNIYDYIDNGEGEKAKEYIKTISGSIESTNRKSYSSNETINAIVSYYAEIMDENRITLNYSIRAPKELSCSDVDMTSILSNGLENAVNEMMLLKPEDRIIDLNIEEKNGKLLISLENPFYQQPKFVDGIPISRRKGHGYGTQSIQYTVEKLNGNCRFDITDDKFVLQIIL